MSIFKRNTAYGLNQSESASLSPYDRAKREWDNRIGTARVQALHWRLTAILSLIGMLGLGTGLVYVSINKQTQTIVVQPPRHNQPPRITLAGGQYRPDTAEVGYFVRQVVTLVRSRPLDPVVVRENWKTAYGYLAGEAIATMNSYAVADPPIRTIDGRQLARTVAISNVLQRSKRTYQVRWVETSFIGGVPQRPEAYTGLFEIELMPPRDEAEVFRNPLGIYVVTFSWSKEFTEPVQSDVEPTAHPAATTEQEFTNETNE